MKRSSRVYGVVAVEGKKGSRRRGDELPDRQFSTLDRPLRMEGLSRVWVGEGLDKRGEGEQEGGE